MPASRAIAAELGIGPVTLRRAVARLVAEGVLITRPGAGTYVATPTARAAPDVDWQQVALGASPVDPSGLDTMTRLWDSDAVPLSSSYPDGTIRPDGRVAAAMARASRRPTAWDAAPPEGLIELRAWFASQIGVAKEDVIVSPGGQGSISATMRALLPHGSPVLFAVPTYPGALAVARSAGLVPIPVPTDADGVRPELLERAFATTGARLAYVQPTYANPDGHVLDERRRAEVLEIACAAGAFILEDDWARWLGHGPVAPPPLIRDDDDGHVITITSLSKATAPSMRVGAIAARGPVLQRIAMMRLVDDFFVSRPLQEAAVELVTGAGWSSHVRALSSAFRQRCDALCSSVAARMPECTFVRPAGGVNLWLQLPRSVGAIAVSERALALGVAVSPGTFYIIGEPAHQHLRLSIASVEVSAIDDAVRRVAQAVVQSVRSQ